MFLVFLAIICPFLVAEEIAACGLCTMVVGLLENKASVLSTREDWIKELFAITDEVCANVQLFASPVQCKSYIELNAPYMVDLMLSESKPQSVCKTIGICNDANDSTNYKLVFPIINEQQITYLVEEKDISQDTEFNYKLFLGNPSFLDSERYHLAIELSQVVDCEVNLKVTNKTTFVQSESCNNDKNCSMDISQPGRGVWYYFTVHAKVSGKKASFFLNATEKNETVSRWILTSHHILNGQRFALILCITFSSVCLLCLCISRCIFSNRRYKHRQQQIYSPIMMQPIPETVIPIQDFAMFGSQQPFDPEHVSPMFIMYSTQPIANAQV